MTNKDEIIAALKAKLAVLEATMQAQQVEEIVIIDNAAPSERIKGAQRLANFEADSLGRPGALYGSITGGDKKSLFPHAKLNGLAWQVVEIAYLTFGDNPFSTQELVKACLDNGASPEGGATWKTAASANRAINQTKKTFYSRTESNGGRGDWVYLAADILPIAPFKLSDRGAVTMWQIDLEGVEAYREKIGR